MSSLSVTMGIPEGTMKMDHPLWDWRHLRVLHFRLARNVLRSLAMDILFLS